MRSCGDSERVKWRAVLLWGIPFVVALVGVVLAITGVYVTRHQEYVSLQEELDGICDKQATVLESRVQNMYAFSSSFVGLMTINPDTTRQQYEDFAFGTRGFSRNDNGSVTSRHLLTSVNLIRRVRSFERDAYEQRMSDELGFSVNITACGTGSLHTQTEADEYYPLTYQIRMGQEVKQLYGLDFLSMPDSAQAIETARDSGRTTHTSPLLVSGTSVGVSLIIPLYVPPGLSIDKQSTSPVVDPLDLTVDQRRDYNWGVVQAVIDFALLIRNYLQPNLSLRFSHRSPTGIVTTMVEVGDMQSKWDGRTVMSERSFESSDESVWKVECFPTSPLVTRHLTLRPLWLLPLLLVPFVLVAITLFCSLRQSQRLRIENLNQLKTQELLRETTRKLEKANQEKSDFVAFVCHELRNPLHAIVGLTDLLLEQENKPETQKMLETITSSACLMSSIINDILDLSKLDADKLMMETIPMNIPTLIESLSFLFRSMTAQKQLSFVCHVDPDVPLIVLGDPTRLRQILVNLVSNSVKFTASGSVTLSVSMAFPEDATPSSSSRSLANEVTIPIHDVERVSSPDSSHSGSSSSSVDSPNRQFCWLRFAVRDSGIGIDANAVPKLFKSYIQADKSVSRKFGGTGLGLSIVRALVAKMKGVLKLRTEVGKGSEFSFVLRMETPPSPRASPREGHIPPDQDFSPGSVELTPSDVGTISARIEHRRIELKTSPLFPEYDAKQSGGLGWGSPLAAPKPRKFSEDIELSSAAPLLPPFSLQSPPLSSPTLVGPDQLPNSRPSSPSFGLPPSSSPPAPHPASSPPARRRVLFVEDNVVNQKLGFAMLTRAGIDVDIAANGLEALQRVFPDFSENSPEAIPECSAAAQDYPIIFMDLLMPKMDGFEATRLLRRRGYRGRIVALTGNALVTEKEKCLAAGFDLFISKPFKAEEIVSIVRGTATQKMYLRT